MSRRSMLWIGLALMMGVLLVGSPRAPLNAAATGQSQTSPAPVVAVVNGKEITEQELLDRVRGEMSKLEAQMYEVRRNGAEELISDYLLEQTAQSPGIDERPALAAGGRFQGQRGHRQRGREFLCRQSSAHPQAAR